MKKLPPCRNGRPRSVIFTEAEGRELAMKYLDSNKDSTSGSATMAARVYAASHEPLACALDRRASKHSLPQAVWDAVAPARQLVAFHRQGERGLRGATYTPGTLRLTPERDRRLFAGEQMCSDDGTVNFGVVVPWPFGGDRCSDKYGVKLGRFQLFPAHDDATSFTPAFNYIVRPQQQYTAADVSGFLLRVVRDVCKPERFVVEGGNWQAKRTVAALRAMGVQLVSVKGRPNQKLIENYFNRLWTRLSMELPYAQVGRYRDDDKLGQALYCKCQEGRDDPRKYFPMLDVALAAIETALRWLNTEPIESREYGTWVPLERWLLDMEQHPRQAAQDNGHLWIAAPVLEERTVRRGMVTVTAFGPLGQKTPFHFSSPDLWSYQGKQVRVAFDPLQSPCIATIAHATKEQVLCEAVDVDPFAQGDTSTEVSTARALRALMRREYRVLLPDKSGAQRITVAESERRATDHMMEVRRGGNAPAEEVPVGGPSVGTRTAPLERGTLPAPTPRTTRADLSQSLRRRAANIPQHDATF